jgi:uncharacterized membrane protein YhaH (DUF805 family)
MNSSLNSTTNRERFGTVAVYISLFASAYPLLAIAVARIHYALASKDFSPKVEAWLLLLVFPVCLCCALSLVLALRSGGKRRTTGIICSSLGAVLNVLFFLAVGATY